MDKRKILIISSSTIVTFAVAYFIYTKIRNKKEIAKINSIIDKGTNAKGTLDDISNIFTGNSYISKIMAQHKGVILLRDKYVTSARRKIHQAIAGWGTDEQALKNVFSSLRDKVAIAQVSASYKKYYGENMLTAIKGDLDNNSSTMIDLTTIVKNKPNFRVKR